MIVRTWHGLVPVENGDSFYNYLLETGVKEAENIKGNIKTNIIRKIQDTEEHFFMISYWVNLNSIKEFAGENFEIAVKYHDDEKYGLISDPIVLHHEIIGKIEIA